MKKIMSILGICLLCSDLCARPSVRASSEACIGLSDSVFLRVGHADSLFVIVGRFITPVLFGINKYDVVTTPQLEAVVDSIRSRSNTLARIRVRGSASPDGPQPWNLRLGQYRAEALASYLSRRTGLSRGLFQVDNQGEDWASLSRALSGREEFPHRERIQSILASDLDSESRKRAIRALDGGKTWRLLIAELFPGLRNACVSLVSAIPKLSPLAPGIAWPEPSPAVPRPLRPAPVPFPAAARDMSGPSSWTIAAKTNLLFDAVLVANLGVEVSPWPHWSLDIPVWYSPYDLTPTRRIRVLAVQPEIRWWPRRALTGHFVGLHAHAAGFNISLDDYARYQDPNHALWGLGLSYGYALPLGREGRWGLEFTVGAGFAQYRYDAYRNRDDGPKFESGSDCYWGITRAGITLSYKWELSRKGCKK